MLSYQTSLPRPYGALRIFILPFVYTNYHSSHNVLVGASKSVDTFMQTLNLACKKSLQGQVEQASLSIAI
jgi:hypothetical protein